MHICFGHQRWLPGPSKQLYQANSFFYRRTWLMLASISEIVSSSSVMKFCEIIGEDYNCGYVWLQIYYTRLLLPHSFCLTQSLILTQGRTRSSLQLRFYESLIIYPWSTSQCEKNKNKQSTSLHQLPTMNRFLSYSLLSWKSQRMTTTDSTGQSRKFHLVYQMPVKPTRVGTVTL